MVIVILLSFSVQVFSQTGQKGKPKYSVSGRIFEQVGEKIETLPFASVSFTDYSISTQSNGNGNYVLNDVPEGKSALRVHYIGKVTVDTIIDIKSNVHIDIILKESNFRLKEVTITAVESKARSTASIIPRSAMDHLQATSLTDIMSLLPGGLSNNQDLSNATEINIRNISSSTTDKDMNGMGTSIIQNGAPLSNNANLTSLNPIFAPLSASLAGGASPVSGFDARKISTNNIESVEIVRGIPSVEYGDLTSGAVIINTKAGIEPLQINTKVNPNVYELSARKGVELGKEKGTLNVGVDYAYNYTNPIQSYLHYQRTTASIIYSNMYLKNRLKNNISLDLSYGRDQRDKNPDDTTFGVASDGKDLGFILNTNGFLTFKDLWLKSIKYVASFSYTSKKSYYESTYTNASAPYSMTTTDGEILSNTAGQHVYDVNGKEITNFASPNNYAVFLPSTYRARYDIDGKEINFFAKLTSNFFKKIGNTYNRFFVGADFKTDGNNGKGKTWDPANPPYRVLTTLNASFRPRAYKDIPFVKQLGIFAEQNFKWSLGERDLNIQAGLRFDKVSVLGNVWSPRINGSIDIFPKYLTLRGGYGITAKMPTVMYLYPEPAYFEYININELNSSTIPENERLFITTTRIFDSSNKNLQIAKNHKAEIGFDLRIKQARLAVTAFDERMKNGYCMDLTPNTFKPVTINEYSRNAQDKIYLSSSNSGLAEYNTPTNNRVLNTKGLEFDLNLGRFDPIRTAFSINGGWFWTESYNNNYTYFDESSESGSARKDVGVYEKGMQKYNMERLSTALRVTHNIPNIGFVITLTAQTIWKEANWYKMGNDSIPIGYISKDNGSLNLFTPGQYTSRSQITADGKESLLRSVNSSYRIKESFSPVFCFNINVTKEIGKYLRASFFANNMFRSYPVFNSKRTPGTKVLRNQDYFFGFELSLTL